MKHLFYVNNNKCNKWFSREKLQVARKKMWKFTQSAGHEKHSRKLLKLKQRNTQNGRSISGLVVNGKSQLKEGDGFSHQNNRPWENIVRLSCSALRIECNAFSLQAGNLWVKWPSRWKCNCCCRPPILRQQIVRRQIKNVSFIDEMECKLLLNFPTIFLNFPLCFPF